MKLPPLALEALRRHSEAQEAEKSRMIPSWNAHGLVFCTTTGTPLDRHNVVNRSFKPLLEKAGLPDVRFHDLRHTCATILLAQGKHPKFVQGLLGHATVGITMDTYSHVMPGMDDGLADAMENALS